MMKSCLYFFILALLAGPVLAQEAIPEEVRATVQARVENDVNESIIVGVVDSSGTHYYSYGHLGATDERTPDAHTLFEIGSITKVFTALLLADMVQRGEVALDDPITKYLPDSVKADERITLYHLATHTSGLPRMPDNFSPANPADPYADYTVPQLHAFLSGYSLPREPGARYEYSNLGMGLLGHLLALHAGMPYEQLLEDRIISVLDLEDTRITLTPEQEERLAPGHSDGQEVSNWNIGTLAGAGALRSTAHDLLRFLAANLGFVETPLASAMAMIREPREEADGSLQVGLGWHIREGDGGAIIWHNGGTGGYKSYIGFDLAKGKGVAVLTNSNRGIDDIGFHLLDPRAPLTEVQVAVEVAPEVLERYVGTYELAPTFLITVTREGNQLFIQATGQPRAAIYPSSETEFFLRVVDAQITFHAGEDGTISSLTLHQNGRDLPGQKIR